ncbi:MAG TPA: hypothetical protein VFI09_03480 [Solirubrobacterales bacterium]|nr:hypothetical protein [Solirubrobacterales bacterium]
MSGTRGIGRIVAMGIALALALLLLAAREATAGNYRVAQCGWNVGIDASWADDTGGAKFRQDASCGFGAEHMKSFTQGGPTVSGTHFARWRWEAPAGTGISRVWGIWWHALHDGMEQRFGPGNAGGGFDPTLTATTTDTTQRDFATEFGIPAPAIEDRLLCARTADRWCSIESESWSAVRSLTIDVFDGYAPVPGNAGADLAAGGWRRGAQRVNYWDSDVGGGVRFSETLLDGNRVGLTEYPCAKAMIDGEWRATQMRPCPLGAADEVTVQTTDFSDGPHALTRCATDFAGNSACLFPTTVLIDNNPPAHPRSLSVAGGEGWHSVDDFDLSWVNPGQGPASPIGGAYWRITGPSGYDTGVSFAAGHEIAALADRKLPRPGIYSFRIWLRDEAGNADAGTAIEVPLRLDDVPPAVAFEPVAEQTSAELPQVVRAEVSDEHSGPAGGTIAYRRVSAEQWTDLPTKMENGGGASTKQLVAAVPGDLEPGTYVFRAEATDGAGNDATTTRCVDGTEMALRKLPPPVAPAGPAAHGEAGGGGGEGSTGPPSRAKAKTRLFARLRWRHRRGQRVTVPFGAGAALTGRLLNADGAGLSRRRLRIVSRPSHGALMRRRVATVRTGRHGGFRLALPAGPSRHVTVVYPGESGLARSRRPALALRVRGAATLSAAPRSLRTGQSVRLWGRVRTRGAPLPRRGKLVAIQYYENEARLWRPVLVTRSDHSGRFHARYRFRYIEGTAKIRLRAVALAEERWPYAPGASRSVLVRVSG